MFMRSRFDPNLEQYKLVAVAKNLWVNDEAMCIFALVMRPENGLLAVGGIYIFINWRVGSLFKTYL